jgi:release factor glutamine methyltransferase
MIQKKWTIKEILHTTASLLKDKGIDSPRLCAEVLLSYQLKKSRVELYLAFDRPLSSNEIAGYRSLLKRRLDREPLQYITGHQEFWALEFSVSPAVLIPRQETELLVEEAVNLKKNNLLKSDQPSILDLGTGSGAITVSLAKAIENAVIWASDISFEALAVAKVNAKHHGVEKKIKFCQGDLWQPFSGSSDLFDMIVSNPPYIPSEVLKTLPAEIRYYEPLVALEGYENGMRFIKKIIEESEYYLKPGGWLLIEMDPDQTEKALYLINKTGAFNHKERMLDYQKKYRLIKAQKKDG